MSNPDELLTTQQTLDILKISRKTLYALMERNVIKPVDTLPVLKKRPRLLFKKQDVEQLLHKP